MSQLHWIALLERAARQLDGGGRSFPVYSEADAAYYPVYNAPSEHYRRFFFRKATTPGSQQDPSLQVYSAGWLLPDEDDDCSPVFIAHSTMSAIWLLKKTLPQDTLPDSAWSLLVLAAHSQVQDSQEIPPSGQRKYASSKRPALDSLLQDPKRARLDLGTEENPGQSDPASPQQSELSQLDERAEGEPTLITTVTNRNRQAEQARKRKREARMLKEKQSSGLVSPPPDAPSHEKAAYASISQQDESIIAWVIKQPVKDTDFYTTARLPYTTAAGMLDKVRTVGCQTARFHAAAFLHSWRSRGTPFPTQSTPDPAVEVSSDIATRRDLPWLRRDNPSQRIENAFRKAWTAVNYCESELATVNIQYRWAMAFLGQAYADQISYLEQEDQTERRDQSRSRNGKGHLRTQAINSLLLFAYEEATSKEKDIFRRRLLRASRWYEAAKELGWGILCLMPHDSITVTWVEQTLRIAEWRIWLQLVKKVGSDAWAASRELDMWLGPESIAGGSLGDKERLRIEADPHITAYEIEEVDNEDEDELVCTQSQVTSARPAAAPSQWTLVELFKPT